MELCFLQSYPGSSSNRQQLLPGTVEPTDPVWLAGNHTAWNLSLRLAGVVSRVGGDVQVRGSALSAPFPQLFVTKSWASCRFQFVPPFRKAVVSKALILPSFQRCKLNIVKLWSFCHLNISNLMPDHVCPCHCMSSLPCSATRAHWVPASMVQSCCLLQLKPFASFPELQDVGWDCSNHIYIRTSSCCFCYLWRVQSVVVQSRDNWGRSRK